MFMSTSIYFCRALFVGWFAEILRFFQEVDAGLLSIIGYPAFAVNSPRLVDITRQEIASKLQVKVFMLKYMPPFSFVHVSICLP